MRCQAETSPPTAAYVHVPFCRHRCGYCNFSVVVRRGDLIPSYLAALERELASLQGPHPVETLFLGGGTPTELPPEDLDHLLHVVQATFVPRASAEVSVEANPENLSPEICDVLASHNVNRVSLGVQSFHPAKLEFLERAHDADHVIAGIERLNAFATAVSLDLMFGVPGEEDGQWHQDLQAALRCAPHHISTYGLTIERGTAFWSRRHRGQLHELHEDRQRALYQQSILFWTHHGYEHYEVSNFAKRGYRCRHNQVYWEGAPYFAVGPGASRFVNGWRETNHRSTTTYIRRMLSGNSPVAEREQLSRDGALRERLVFALRMIDGIDVHEFEHRNACSLDDLFEECLHWFCDQGWMTFDCGRLRLTDDGLMLSDSLWPYLLTE